MQGIIKYKNVFKENKYNILLNIIFISVVNIYNMISYTSYITNIILYI